MTLETILLEMKADLSKHFILKAYKHYNARRKYAENEVLRIWAITLDKMDLTRREKLYFEGCESMAVDKWICAAMDKLYFYNERRSTYENNGIRSYKVVK